MVYKGGSARRSAAEVLQRLQAHYGSALNFNLSVYTGSKKPLRFECPVHGEQSRKAELLIAGRGCAACGTAKGRAAKRVGCDALIERFKKVHGGLYDYSDVFVSKTTDHFELVCQEHGAFRIGVNQHLSGAHCQRCGYRKCGVLGTSAAFTAKAKSVHGDRYDYANTVYHRYHDNIVIVCREHGEFAQTPNNHLQGKGCPTCGYGSPKAEDELCQFLDDNGIKYQRSRRQIIPPFELDIYIPKYQLAIEHNGLYWHSDKVVDNHHSKLKRRLCKDRGIRLLQVLEDEWLKRPEAIKSLILAACGKIDKVYARNTEFRKQDNKAFMARHHHAGDVAAKHRYVLVEDDEVVAAISFRPVYTGRRVQVEGAYEIARLASSKAVVGGVSKLLKHAIKDLQPKTISTFCDLRLFTGASWAALGFKWVHRTAPTGWYVRDIRRWHPRGFTKARREKIADLSKFNRLYDCGHDKYLLEVEDG